MSMELGHNVSILRHKRSMTQQELADKLSENLGYSVSVKVVGQLERGVRDATEPMLRALTEVLRCSMATLFYGSMIEPVDDIDHRLFREIMLLPDEAKQILMYGFCAWPGDSLALVYAAGAYMIIAKSQSRADIAGMCLHVLDRAKAEGLTRPDAPEVDMDYVTRAWLKIATDTNYI